MAVQGFDTWDYVVFVAILVLSASVGIFFAFTGGRNKTNQEFLMANRQMSVVPVALSMVVTIISAITLVGNPGEMYVYGTQLWMYTFGAILGYVVSAVLYVPLMYPLKLTSAYEYLELRFNSKSAKLMGTLITIVNAMLYTGVVMYAPATSMEPVTGSPVWVTLLVVFAVSSFYSALGGIKAVIWVDAIQSIIMLGGVLAIVIKGAVAVGGIDRVFEISNNNSRLQFFDFNPDPTMRQNFWTLIIGGMTEFTARTGVYQAAVQRYCAVPTVRKARITTLLNAPFLIIINTLVCLSGVVMFAYYADKGCDPLRAGYVKNPTQLITYFFSELMDYPGLLGLFAGSIFSAVLSTTSSVQSAVAANIWEDILKPHFQHLSEEKQTWITKGLVILFGAVGTGLAFLMAQFGGTVMQIAISFVGASVGPLLGLFVLACFFPFANWIGAVVGSIVGLAFPLWISFGAYFNRSPANYLPTDISSCVNLTASLAPVTQPPSAEGIEKLYTISFQYYGFIGMATVVLVGIVVSLITGPTKIDEVDPKYLIPVFDWLFCYLPKSWRRRLQCGIDYESVKEFRKSGGEDEVIKSSLEKGSEIQLVSITGLKKADM